MPSYRQGRKAKEFWHNARKVKELWHMGRRVYTSKPAFNPRTFTATVYAGWETGSVTGDSTLVQSISIGGLYLAEDATYTTVGGGGGLFYADTREPIAEGEVVRAGQKLRAQPGTYVFTEVQKTQRKPVEVMPPTPGDFDAINWLRWKLAEYGEDYRTVTELPFDIDSRNATNMRVMFADCSALTTVPALDTARMTTMSGMFQNCSSLTTVPEMDTRNVTNMAYMFNGCSALTTVPQLDTRNVTTMRTMFQDCRSLTSVPEMDTRNVTNMAYMFASAFGIARIPDLATSQVADMTEMFWDCRSLTDGNVRLIGKHPRVNTYTMISGSGLTREPFYDSAGRPI